MNKPVVFEIYVREVGALIDEQFEAHLTVEWPEGRALPATGDTVWFDDMILKVETVIHSIGRSYMPDVIIRANMDGQVGNVDTWFKYIEENLDHYGEPGMCKKITKEW